MNAKLALFALVILTAPGLALADTLCTRNGIAGTWGFNVSGTILSPNASNLPSGPVAGAGMMVFDNQGHFHGQETLSFNGSISSGVTFNGTYVINPDCTFTLEDPGFFHNFGVLVADG